MKGFEVRDMEVPLRNPSQHHQQSINHSSMTARNPKRSSSQTPPFIHSRSHNSGNSYFESLPQMEMMMNPPYPFPLSSYHEFRQPPLLPHPMAAFSPSPSSSTHFQSLPPPRGSGSSIITSTTHKKMHKGSNKPSKTKKYPDVKPDLGKAKRWVSESESLPKNVTLSDVSTINPKVVKFSELVFAMAPPPSSLPIPKFSLKPKV